MLSGVQRGRQSGPSYNIDTSVHRHLTSAGFAAVGRLLFCHLYSAAMINAKYVAITIIFYLHFISIVVAHYPYALSKRIVMG